MPNHWPSAAAAAPQYEYAPELARFVLEHWPIGTAPDAQSSSPKLTTLTQFLAACYHASLMRDEERPVTFRTILSEPELIASGGRPPESLQRLLFQESLPLDASGLRRLSVAADTQRALIGVQPRGEDGLRIWGLVNSGARWLRDVRGGRRAGAPLPPVPVAHVDSPGSVNVYAGQELVARIRGGHISGSRADPFNSTWLPARFADFGDELLARHTRSRITSSTVWAPLEDHLPREIAQRMMKRVIALLRDARHGGTLIFVSPESAADLGNVHSDAFIDLKYRFKAEPRQPSFRDLVVSILNRLAANHGTGPDPAKPVGWLDFETAADDELARLDEALFETAHLIASLASADGAVVMNKHHDILGFGGMISGRRPSVKTVARALDLDATATMEEGTENVGARHQSAYRLAAALPDAVVIVVSQDGHVRFVAQRAGRVTYWEQE